MVCFRCDGKGQYKNEFGLMEKCESCQRRDMTFEKIIDTVKKLSEEEQEQLFFTVNKEYAKALGKMKEEARKEHKKGRSVSLEELG